MPIRRLLAAVWFALCLPALPATAGAIPTELRGTWSEDTACGPDAMTVLFTGATMEIRQDNERRSLSEVDARASAQREIELRATRIVFVRQPNASPPVIGDILRFRRDGNVLRLTAMTMQGTLVTVPPDSTVFTRCRR